MSKLINSQQSISLAQIRQAMALKPPAFDPQDAQLKMAPRHRHSQLARPTDRPGNARLAATLLLFYPVGDQLYFVLTRRPDELPQHPGQISLPGGRLEDGESYQEAALRETCEEIGVCESIELLGALHNLYIPPSDFIVYPFVGYVAQRPIWSGADGEVAEIIECPVELLLDDSIKGAGKANVRGFEVDIEWYQVEGYHVWGATAIMLSEMEWRLRAVLPD